MHSCVCLAATRGTLEAHVVVGADAAPALLPVDAPEAFLQTGVHHLPGVRRCHPVGGAGLHGRGPGADPLPVVETDRLQALVVSVASRMVDVEPGRPLCHAWGGHVDENQKKGETNKRVREGGGCRGPVHM